MHVVWQWVHPVRMLMALYVFLGILAFTIHFILLSTERYNWLQNQPAKRAEINAPAQPVVVLPNVKFS